jgi:DNA-binding NarL/FixJ family response regulator
MGSANSHNPFERLTPREAQILKLLSLGSSTEQIVDALALSPGTVRNHISQMLRKTGTHSRLDLVVKAQEAGFFERH